MELSTLSARERRMVRLLGELCQAVPTVLNDRQIRRDTCILHTRIALLALRELGVRCRPLATQLVVGNEPWARVAIETGHAPPQDQWPPGAYALGIGFSTEAGRPRNEERYDGHVIALVNERWGLDLTLDQCDRPQHGIVLRPGYFEAAPLIADGRCRFTLNDCLLEYTLLEDRGYLTAPDWTLLRANQHWRGFHPVREVLDQMRGRTAVA